MNVENVNDLLDQYLTGTITNEGKARLALLLEQAENQEKLESLMKENFHSDRFLIEEDPKLRDEIQKWLKLRMMESGEEKSQATVVSRTPVKRMYWLRIAAASVIGLVLLSGAYLLLMKKDGGEVIPNNKPALSIKDIAPGGDRALLTLADGTTIILDSAADGSLTRQGGVKVIKLGGQLAYQKDDNTTEILWNTITTPKGGQYQLVLADGSKVWLNAASSLRFPTVFKGNERKVELSGEGYFEISSTEIAGSQKKLPFIVAVGDMSVEVTGTHFNINSYDDEPTIKTTLLEGKVSVRKGENMMPLNPGQQAIIPQGKDNIQVTKDVDLEEVMAWKNGRFMFNNANVEAIMRQAARWYDVDVVFKGNISETFSGNPPRSEYISKLLNVMEATGKVDFEINGRQIIVKPKQ